MTRVRKKYFIKIAIDSPAAAGAGTVAKALSKYYNLYYLDTGKIYRLIAYYKIKFPKKFNQNFIRNKMKKLRIEELNNKELISAKIGSSASIIAKNKSIRKLVRSFQVNSAYNPPKKFNGSCLDGRDITYNIVPDANFKFFITANIKTRAYRRYKELKKLEKKITYTEVLKSIKKRDKSDKNRKFGPLKKTKDSILINTTKLSRKRCFEKIKAIMDRKIKS